MSDPWKKLHWVLFVVVLAVGVIRLLSGNLVGAVVAFVLAAVFFSIAADYPLVARIRRLWRIWRKTSR